MKELLIKLKTCQKALEWVGDKTWEEIYKTCHRGDWLLWLHYRTNKKDLKLRTLAKGHCANTVRYLMKDKRSLKAVDTAIAYGEGRATRAELDSVCAAAAAAGDADDAYVAVYAAYAAYSAAAYDAVNASVYAAYASDAKIKNQQETADIVRKYIPIELWNVNKMIETINKQI